MKGKSSKRSRFRLRPTISLLTAWGFGVMCLTGLVLYIEPHGRVAYWSNWTLMGLGKEQWDAVHVVSSALFVMVSSIHFGLNWKPFVGFLHRRIGGALRLRWELGASAVIVLFVVVSALGHIPPLGYIIDLSEWAKSSWERSPEDSPPFGHAEMHSIESFCRKMQIDLDRAASVLEANGIVVASTDETLEAIANDCDTTPAEIYGWLRPLEESVDSGPKRPGK